jgi:hypothetical protein
MSPDNGAISQKYRAIGDRSPTDSWIPMGAWCSNASRTYEDAAKAAADTRPIRQERVWRVEATLLRKKLQGGSCFLDKGPFMGAA